MPASQARPLRTDELATHYESVRRTTLDVVLPFSPEDQMLQSMPEASPLKWHLAHTTWFFETFILTPHFPGYKPFDPRFQTLFNSYYKQLGEHPYRGARGLMSRPSNEEVLAYRRRVDDSIARFFESIPEPLLPLVELGLNHEQQHQELMVTDVKHALWAMPLRGDSKVGPTPVAEAAPLLWIDVAGGTYDIGHQGDTFSFDNERPRHRVLLEDFQVASRQVTNSEYLAFMRDGGYRRPELWLSDGWDIVCQQNWNAPQYWEERDGTWFSFSFDGPTAVNPAAPVCHVSYYEADAFARWSGARLPREEEWEVAASRVHPVKAGCFLEDWKFEPVPVTGDTPQWYGNVWEWTSGPYVAYPGFVPETGVVGEYNGKFMCNQFVLRGGSCATPRGHIRSTYRNFFPPHARWQFMGIRLAK